MAPLNANTPDANAPDAAPDAAPPPACVDDRFGFSTAELPAIRLDSGLTEDLVVCPPDVDWFALAAPAGARRTVQVQADRPVRLIWGEALSPAGRQVELAGVVAPGQVVIGIEAVDSAAPVGYAIRITETLSACDDALPDGVHRLVAPVEGAVCGRDRDRFVVEGPPGAQVIWRLTPIEGAARMVDQVPLAAGDVPAQIAETRLERRLDADGQAWLVVEPRDAGGRYRLSAEIVDLDALPATRSGVVRVPDRPVTLDGLASAAHLAIEGVLIDVVVDGQLAGLARTDATGAFTLRYAAPADAAVVVRARASVWIPPFRVTVGPSLDTPWAAPLDAEIVDLPADAPIGGALHIAQAMADGARGLAPFLPQMRVTPPINVRWTLAGSAACGTCYRPRADVIDISGRLSDPDEWDDAILLHELAHHFAARYGRDDSPGGAHDGDPVAPALAWSEGFATTTGAWLNGSAQVLDYRVTGTRATDLEAMPDPRANGTDSGRADGDLSEYLVAAVLWDLLDDPAADDDPFALDPAAVFGAAFAGLRVRDTDAGAPGMDLLDHAEVIACRAGLDPSPALAERAVEADVRCRQKPGARQDSTPGVRWRVQAGAAIR